MRIFLLLLISFSSCITLGNDPNQNIHVRINSGSPWSPNKVQRRSSGFYTSKQEQRSKKQDDGDMDSCCQKICWIGLLMLELNLLCLRSEDVPRNVHAKME